MQDHDKAFVALARVIADLGAEVQFLREEATEQGDDITRLLREKVVASAPDDLDPASDAAWRRVVRQLAEHIGAGSDEVAMALHAADLIDLSDVDVIRAGTLAEEEV